MPNNEYKDRYLDGLERDIKEGKKDRDNIKTRLHEVEQKSHVHNGDKEQSDLPRVFEDKGVIITVSLLIIVVITAVVLWTTGENLLGGL